MVREAYSFARTFAPAPARDLLVNRHYLLSSASGALRLEEPGQTWLLPPARAALIEAGRPVRVSIPRSASTASVLFSTDFAAAPPAPLSVFDLSPLARALIAECRNWEESEEPLSTYAATLFTALVAVTWRLAEHPSPAVLPTAQSAELGQALKMTQEGLAGDLRFDDVAARVGLAPRSLARRFEDEMGMTWRAVVRRMRVLRAIEELAAGDAPVTQIAFTVGYASLSAFNAAFRDLTGRTPSEYRASFRP